MSPSKRRPMRRAGGTVAKPCAVNFDAMVRPFVVDLPADRLAALSASLAEPLANLRCELERAERARERRPDEAASFTVLALVAAMEAVAVATTCARRPA